jgi:DnaK suppressor protein
MTKRYLERAARKIGKSMTQDEIYTFQSLLKAKAAEATKALKNREGISVERTADELEDIATAFARDIVVQHLDRESHLLRQILGALCRIENGTFGACVHCEDEISPKRLAAVPWAPFCLACQEAADRGDHRVLQTAEQWIAQAA